MQGGRTSREQSTFILDGNNQYHLRLEEIESTELLEQARCVICKLTPEGDVTYVNPYIKEVTGYSPEEIIGRNWWEIFYPGEYRKQVDRLYEDFKKGDVTDYEMRLVGKDGSERVISWNSFNQWDTNLERIIEVKGIGIDITERKRIEDALRESKTRYQCLFENSPVSLWEEDASEVKRLLDSIRASGVDDFRLYLEYHPEVVAKCARLLKVKNVNKATVELYEAADKTDLLKSVDSVFTEESFDAFREELIAIAKGKKSFQVESVNRTLKGKRKEVLVRWSVMPGCEDDYSTVLVTIFDITERKRFEKALKESEERYRLLAENVNDILWTMDMDLKFTFVSPSIQKILGYKPEEVVGRKFDWLLSPQSVEKVMTMISEELAPDISRLTNLDRVRVMDLEHIRSDGSRMWAEVKITFLRDSEDRAIGIVGVTRDISERKEAFERLKRSSEAQRILKEILEISLNGIPLEEMLQRVLDRIVSVQWFNLERKGAIFLVEDDPAELVMKVHSGLTDENVRACRRRKVGECGCGQAAVARKVVFSDGSPETRKTFCTAFRGYTHYSVPIISSGNMLGVMSLFASQDHEHSKEVEQFLESVADAVAGVIVRKRTEDALRESEENYRTIFNAVNEALFVQHVETGAILDANEKACEVFGYPCDEIKKLTIEDLSSGVPPYTQEEILRRIKAANESGPQAFEWRCKRKGGEEFWAEVNLKRAVIGGTPRILALLRDITQKRAAEEALRQSEERFSAIARSSVDAIILIDNEGKVRFWNDAAERMFGYTFDEIYGKELHKEIAPQRYYEAYKKGFSAFTRTGKGMAIGKTLELVGQRKNGEEFPVELSVAAIQIGDKWHAAAVVRDITERKKTEQELHESQQRFRALSDATSEGIVIHDDGKIIDVNQALVKMFGYTSDELSNMLLADLLNDEAKGRVPEELKSKIGEPIEAWGVRKDGTTFPIEITTRTIPYKGREVFVSSVTDITIRKQIEREKEEMHHAQKLESIGRLAAGIAHEINTPTQFVGDNTRFLQDAFRDLTTLLSKYQEVVHAIKEGQDPTGLIKELDGIAEEIDLEFISKEIPQAIQQSLEGIERVSNIVKAMKEFSHPDSGEKVPADLNKAIQSTVTVARNEWKYVANMELDLDPTLPPVPCYVGEFNQVILNLIVNAAHAIEDVVKDKEGEKGTIRVSTRRDGDWVEIRVSDTGCGIPDSIKSKIFEPFFTTKEAGKGTGQGLSVAYSVIVEKHKGTITFESEVGKGTTFIIRLPLNQ